MPQDKGCGYYFQAPLKCKDRICHQTVPQHVHHAECEHSLYMNEQWNLAQPSKASIMSQHNTRSTLLAAKEQRFTSFMMLFGFLLRLAFGSGTPSEEKVTPEDTGRPIGEIMKGLFTAIFQLLSNLLRYSISAIWQGIKRVDWDRAWKIMAFVYIAYIWGGKEEKRLDKLGEMVRGRQRVVMDLTGVDGPRYMLVEDMRGWCKLIDPGN